MGKRIPPDFIQNLLTRADIVELISASLSVKKNGANYVACCPFHQEKTPSFSISPQKQFYYCFGCGASGNAIGFLMNYRHLNFVEAVEALAAELSIPVVYENTSGTFKKTAEKDITPLLSVLKRAAVFYQKSLREHAFGKAAIDYLKKRGLSGKTCQHFALGVSPPGWDNLLTLMPKQAHALEEAGLLIKKNPTKMYDRFRERIMFPIRDAKGNILGFGARVFKVEEQPKYLNSPETPVFHKGKEIYGIYEIVTHERQIDYLVVVEGYMDVVQLREQGITKAVATLGTAVTADHVRKLFKYTKTVYFCFDGDNAGLAAAKRALEVSIPFCGDNKKIGFVFLSDGEDPDSIVQKQGKEYFLNLLKSAQPLSEFLIKTVTEKINTYSVEGLSEVIARAKPYFEKTKPGIFKDLLFKTLVKRTGAKEDDLAELLQSANMPLLPAKQKSREPVQNAKKRLILLLINHPEFISATPAPILACYTKETQNILAQINQALSQNPTLTTGALFEYWRQSPLATALETTLANSLTLSPEALKAEFLGLINQLATQLTTEQKEKQLTALTQKPFAELTEEEKIALKNLIQ